MAQDYNNVIKGYRVQTQIPLNVKKYVANENTLKNLGTSNNLAFTYEQGLRVYCIAEQSIYVWREVQKGEENTGLLDSDFTYPEDLPIIFGINYSNKIFNFFLVNEIYSISNLGNGKEIYKENLITGNKTDFKFRTIDSNNLVLTYSEDGTMLFIDNPSTATIPALYVNNLYTPTREDFLLGNNKGLGTLSKPFTDTISNWPEGEDPVIISNTAIQNALDAYSEDGSQIIVQDNNNAGYIFTGNLNYSKLYLRLESTITSTITDYILNMDSSSFDILNDTVNIDISENKYFVIQGKGFLNSGNTEAGNTFNSGKIINFTGKGILYSDYAGANRLTQYLINADPLNLGNNNDGQVTFNISCGLSATRQGIYIVGGKSRIYITSNITTGTVTNTVDSALRACYQTGGEVSLFGNCTVYFYGLGGAPRLAGFFFNTALGFNSSFSSKNVTYFGQLERFLTKLSTANDTTIRIYNSAASDFYCTNIFAGAVGVPIYNVEFKNNIFGGGSISSGVVDITSNNGVSSTNIIGNYILESLVIYGSKAQAKTAGLPTYSAFINRKTVNAVDLETGVEYKVATSGSPSLGTVGSFFTATGSETGTGTAYLDKRDILT